MTERDDAVRRYFQQRLDAGDQTIVLDTLSRDEALRLAGGGSSGKEGSEGRDGSSGKGRGGGRVGSGGGGEGGDGGKVNWRDSLKAVGAAPESATPVPTSVRPASGLTVGGSGRELFGESSSRLDSLAAVASAVAVCTKCPLYATAKNPVPGEGHHEAQLMLVGEAPGATEDETGRPFVGAAGQLLTKILQAIDFERDQVFICNVLKHRPPGNRNPLPEEVSACSPYLIRQIELVRPKVILALGTFAAQTLLNTKLTIGKLRGQVHRYHGVPLVVTYHPAALLRNPGWKRPTWEDVQLARRILDGLDVAPPPDA